LIGTSEKYRWTLEEHYVWVVWISFDRGGVQSWDFVNTAVNICVP